MEQTMEQTRDRVTIGVDVAKATLAVAVWHHGTSRSLGSFANACEGWEALAAQVEPQGSETASTAPLTVVLEPTGGYEAGLALWAYQRGWQVLRPNPRQVRDWAKSQGRRAKTDGQDALVLAQYGAQVPTPPWQPLPAEVSALEHLLHQRDEVEDLQQRTRTRQQQLVSRPDVPTTVKDSIARMLEWLDGEHADVEQAIAAHLAEHPQQCAARDLLLSVPGVGARNVLPLLVTLSRWHAHTGGRGSPKGVVAFVGLDPQPYQSGSSVHRHPAISRQGDPHLRSRLYMGALGALRGKNAARSFYDHLVGRGKPKKLALVAAARKILVWTWAVYQSGTPFDATKTGHLIA